MVGAVLTGRAILAELIKSWRNSIFLEYSSRFAFWTVLEAARSSLCFSAACRYLKNIITKNKIFFFFF